MIDLPSLFLVGATNIRLPLPWWLGVPLLAYWVVVAVLLIMDVRSLRLHKELMVWLYDESKALEMERTFDADLEHCREVTLIDVEGVPVRTSFRNSFARLFSAQI